MLKFGSVQIVKMRAGTISADSTEKLVLDHQISSDADFADIYQHLRNSLEIRTVENEFILVNLK